MLSDDEPLLSWFLEIQGREFWIEVYEDGVTYWDDHMKRRTGRHPQDEDLELRAFIGDARARKRLRAEATEHTISFSLPKGVMEKIKQAAALSKDESRWTARHEQELDALLEPFFWSEVNPYINDPLKKPPCEH